MKIVEPGFEILDELDGDAILRKIERCGRVCYKSEDKINAYSAPNFISRIIVSGHESVLEHFSFTVRFVVDRGVSHEIVRHRLASYSQESTRYCKYADEITVIKPCYLSQPSAAYTYWEQSCKTAEECYIGMLRAGCSPQEARAVLPNSLKTEIVMTANLREWRWFFKQRISSAAHPQIREIAASLLKELKERIPVVFEDIYECRCFVEAE